MYEDFPDIRQATVADGADVFGPYTTAGYTEWSRFFYFEFHDLAALFRPEQRLREIDYMNSSISRTTSGASTLARSGTGGANRRVASSQWPATMTPSTAARARSSNVSRMRRSCLALDQRWRAG
jgi:hypothetical protein